MGLTIGEAKKIGLDTLAERLGIADATLFIMERGPGNYTEERKKIFDKKAWKKL